MQVKTKPCKQKRFENVGVRKRTGGVLQGFAHVLNLVCLFDCLEMLFNNPTIPSVVFWFHVVQRTLWELLSASLYICWCRATHTPSGCRIHHGSRYIGFCWRIYHQQLPPLSHRHHVIGHWGSKYLKKPRMLRVAAEPPSKTVLGLTVLPCLGNHVPLRPAKSTPKPRRSIWVRRAQVGSIVQGIRMVFSVGSSVVVLGLH